MNKTINDSHIQKAKDMAQSQMIQICTYMGWTMQKYCSHQLTGYEVFLQKKFKQCSAAMLNEVRYSSIMSGFWKNEWTHRNAIEFLPFAQDMLAEAVLVSDKGQLIYYQPSDSAIEQVQEEYHFINSPKRLINDENFMAQFNHTLKLIRDSNK